MTFHCAVEQLLIDDRRAGRLLLFDLQANLGLGRRLPCSTVAASDPWLSLFSMVHLRIQTLLVAPFVNCSKKSVAEFEDSEPEPRQIGRFFVKRVEAM